MCNNEFANIFPFMRKNFIFFFLICFLLAAQCRIFAASDLIQRFFPLGPRVIQAPNIPEINISEITKEPIDIPRQNEAAELNNQGVKALNDGNPSSAVDFFRQASEVNPHEVGIMKNLVLALQQRGQYDNEIVEICKMWMALAPNDHLPALLAGNALAEKMNRASESLAYFAEARRRQPDNPEIATSMAAAYERSGHPDQALDLLKQYAPQITGNPYPMYRLGLLLLEKKDYNPAIRALESALKDDKDGYVHDAYIRARFYAGQLDGLPQVCGNALNGYPKIINRKTLERILFSLSPQNYTLTETLKVEISDPDSIKRLNFLVRMPPNIPNHQTILLQQAEWICEKKESSVSPSAPDDEGRVEFAFPLEQFSRSIFLRLHFRIECLPWLGSKGPFAPGSPPDIAKMREDERLDFNNNNLNALNEQFRKMPGNFLQNAFLAIGKGLSYKENFEDHSVGWAFEHPDECDCTEFSWLLSALCLKRGIPARVTTGFLVKTDFIGKETQIGHAWCDIYFKDKGWVSVDPTLGSTMQWAYFGNLLSDQIVFDTLDYGKKARVSVDFTSMHSDLRVKISNSYLIQLSR